MDILQNPGSIALLTQLAVNVIKMRQVKIDGGVTIAVSLFVALLLSALAFVVSNDPVDRYHVGMVFVNALAGFVGANINTVVQRSTDQKRTEQRMASFEHVSFEQEEQ